MAARKRKNPKLGDCYEAAGKYILGLSRLYMDGSKVGGEAADASGLVLIHAEVAGQGPMEGTTFGHGFVLDTETDHIIDRSNGRNLQLPKVVYFAIGGIEDIGNYFEYSPEEMMDNLIKFKHWGPWDLKTRSGL